MKILMIDAFKPDYLEHAPYLKSLTERFQWGELEMPAGHWGGEEIFFKGKLSKLSLFHRRKDSSLRWTKYFNWLEKFGNIGRFVLDSGINIIRLIQRWELFMTGKVPLKQLWKFDFCVRKPLYRMKGLDKKYFSELDNVGHKYGTKSKEIVIEIGKLDKKLSKMEWDIIFSDHGMLDIEKTINVPWTKDCFIDSDMARYWGSKEELEEIRKKLPLKKGKIIDWPDKSFGELIFLANKGVLILPNYWQGNDPVKGMHGYDGKGKDLNAIYILRKKGKKKNLKVEELHKIFMEMINGRK